MAFYPNPDPSASAEVFLSVPQQFIPSHDLIISCGCVIVDPVARTVAILHDRSVNITQLPKGRKNIGESHSDAALREAYEETGVKCKPLPLLVPTRATVPAAHATLELNPSENTPDVASQTDNIDVTDTVINTEPVAICTYPCVFTGAFKLVFWYAAAADSTAAPDPGTKEPWEADLELTWAPAREAGARMTFAADGEVVGKVLADMRRSGYDI